MNQIFNQEENLYEKTIYNKNNVVLKKNVDDDSYHLDMRFNNDNINIEKIYNFNLYALLYELNKDILEDVIVNKEKTENSEVLLVFKQFGAELGIPQKYMCLFNEKQMIGDNEISFIGTNIDNSNEKFNVNKKYEKITVHESILSIKNDSGNQFILDYKFNIDIHENLPLFMQNLIGILIKNIFIRFKQFIENYK